MLRKSKHEKTSRRKKFYLVVIVSLLCVLTIGVGTTATWLLDGTDWLNNNFSGAKVTASVNETFDKVTKSNVSVKNTGTVPAYIRAVYVVNWVDTNGNVYPNTPKEGTDYTVTLGNQWTKNNDGYYYTNNTVAGGSDSPILISQLKPVSGKAPAGYHLEVNVIAHALQQGAKDAVWQPLSTQALPTLPDFEGGMSFSANKLYKATNSYNQAILTFEAVVKIPANSTVRSGVILGNYGGTAPFVNFEIGNADNPIAPRAYYHNGSPICDFIFPDAIIADNEWHHISISFDTTKMRRYCYLDGVAFDNHEITNAEITAINMIAASPFCLGGDMRSGNDQYFKGKIRSVAIFSDVRSHDEVRHDASRMFNCEPLSNNHALLAYYDCLNYTDTQITDMSDNQNHMRLQ